MLTYPMFVSSACSFANVSSLLSLLSFLVDANTIFDDISTYSVTDFSLAKPALTIKGEVSESRKSASCPPSWILLGFFNFFFDFKEG